MRIIPILTALAAMVVLFFLVFQREALREIAGFAPDAPVASEADAAPTVPDNAPRTVAVIAIESVAREIDSAVVLRGRAEAARTLDLMAETSGKVVSPPTPKGALVSVGDVLCEIDVGTRAASRATR